MKTEWTKEQQKEHRRLWVEALRSGKYRQTKRCLHNEEGFCCLGVACDLATVGAWDDENTWGEWYYSVGDESEDTLLPPMIAEWLGLASVEGTFAANSLWRLNDDGKSFAEIADIIESEPEGLLSP